MDYFFKSLDELIKDAQGLLKELNKVKVKKDGKETVQLTGIDGKPTEDDSIFGSRNKIFEGFEKAFTLFKEEFKGEPSIDDFAEQNAMYYLFHEETFVQCTEAFEALLSKVKENLAKISSMKEGMSSGESYGDAEEEFQKLLAFTEAKDLVNDIIVYLNMMIDNRNCARQACNNASMIDLLMVYAENGRKFFDNPENFVFKGLERVKEMHDTVVKISEAVVHNLKCESLMDMITEL